MANLNSEETTLQAVVLADSFNVRFAPLTNDKPRTLLPLANSTLLDYTLQFLVMSGVQEIFVICKAFASDVREHIEKSGWNSYPGLKIITKTSQTYTVGECLREVYTLDVIKNDFILVSGDVVSNFVLTKTIEEHKARLKKDKGAVMTMLLKQVDPGHHLRSREDDLTVALDNNGRLLSYQTQDEGKFRFPQNAFTKAGSAQIRNDILDCHIYVCSPEVLIMFTDEFDCENMLDFINFIQNEETEAVHSKSIFTTVLEREYAARVANFENYDAVGKDILSRWTYPVVPDLFQNHESALTHRRHNIYISDTVQLTSGCVLEENVLVGAKSKIGRTNAPITHISNCIIGKNCTIGAGVKLTNSYIWDNVTIEDDSCIDQAIIADDVVVKAEVDIKPGSILSYGVVVGPAVTIKANSKISLQSGRDGGDDGFGDDDDSDKDAEDYDEKVMGSSGQGYVWESDSEDEDAQFTLWGRCAAQPSDVVVSSDEEWEHNSDEELSDDGSLPAEEDETDDFVHELTDLVTERVLQTTKVPLHELALEITASRSAHNKSPSEVVVALVYAIINSLRDVEGSAKERVGKIKKTFESCAPIFAKYITTPKDHTTFINSIEEVCTAPPQHAFVAFQTIVHAMYENEPELLLEDTILTWYNLSGEKTEDQIRIRKQTQPFIEWLETADEDSDEEDESDSD